MNLTVWVDGDACPRSAREIIFRATERFELPAVLVANHDVQVPHSPCIRSVRVAKGLDVADHRILADAAEGDLVVTQDIPLAAALVARGIHAISPRGEEFTEDNVGDRLATRNLLSDLRDVGEVTGGPAPFGPPDRQRLANAIDRLLTRLLR